MPRLDSTGHAYGRRAAQPPAPADEWSATGLEPPVFHDPSGRRAHAMRGVGFAISSATIAALAIVVTGGIGFSSLPASGPVIAAHAAPPALDGPGRDELVIDRLATELRRTPHYSAPRRAIVRSTPTARVRED